jgi:flagellar hook assembly protein FlgD
MAVFDAGGRQVRALVQANQGAGDYQVRWDGRDDAADRVSPGVYFYRLQAGSQAEVRKMVIME